MVARRTKWRQFCSTCGKQFDAPSTWAYCSKGCEQQRQGFAARDARDDTISEWLNPVYEQRMDLWDQFSMAMPWERSRLRAAIEKNEAFEADMRNSMTPTPPEAVPQVVRPPLERDTPAFWLPILRRESDQFELSMRRSLRRAIVLGGRLLEAKESLPHGEFGRLFADHQDPVPDALPFSPRWAQKLMTIAGNPTIEANTKHASHLPAKLPSDLETVYLLSRVPASELEAAIQRGEVTPDMRRADARELLPQDDAAEPAEPVDEIARVLEPVQRALRRFAQERPSQFGDLRARLTAMLRAIQGEVAQAFPQSTAGGAPN